jgi:hypothetical protein
MKDEIDVPTMEPELEESDYKRFIEDALAEVGKANINRKKPNG